MSVIHYSVQTRTLYTVIHAKNEEEKTFSVNMFVCNRLEHIALMEYFLSISSNNLPVVRAIHQHHMLHSNECNTF